MTAAVCAAALGAAAGWAVRGFIQAQGAQWPAWVPIGGTAALWGVLAAAFGPQGRLLPAAGVALCLWVAACVDARTHRIPNAVVLCAAGVGVLAQCLRVGLTPAGAGLAAAGAAGLLFALLLVLSRGGFGWGDVKLAAAMGCVLGPVGTALALAVTSLAGGVGAAVALAAGLRRLRDPLPFAPFFLVGGLAALIFLARW